MEPDLVRGMKAILGKIVRDMFDEEYLNCDCKVCEKLRRFHEKTQKDIEWLKSQVPEEIKEIHDGSLNVPGLGRVNRGEG